jgi:uncharacterized protein YraI
MAFKGRNVEIHCLGGCLWVTDGKGGERVIEAGRRVTLRTGRKICIQAMTPSVFRITPGPGPAPWRRAVPALLSIMLPARPRSG